MFPLFVFVFQSCISKLQPIFAQSILEGDIWVISDNVFYYQPSDYMFAQIFKIGTNNISEVYYFFLQLQGMHDS